MGPGGGYNSRCRDCFCHSLVDEAQARKNIPIYSGVLAYFPDALLEVAKVSKAGNDQHNPGKPLHWDRPKSSDHMDAGCSHIIDRTKGLIFDTDKQRHLAKRAWRLLAALQLEIEGELKRKKLSNK